MKNVRKIIYFILISALLLGGCGNPKNESSESELETTPDTSFESEIVTENTTEMASEITTENTSETESETTTETTSETESEVPKEPVYTYSDLDKTMYASSSVNVRDLPCKDGAKLGSLSRAKEVHVTGQCNETSWYRIDFEGNTGYVSNNYLSHEKPAEPEKKPNKSENKPAKILTYNLFPDRKKPSAEELSAYTFTEMNKIMYPTNRMSFWYLPCDLNDFDFYCDNSNMSGWTGKFVPTKVTGICNETGMYRLEVDGESVYVTGRKGAFGEDPFITSLPKVTKSDPGYKAGTKEWHDYWDGTTMGEYYLTTGDDPWLTVYSDSGALVYAGSYPNDYVIGSYAKFDVSGITTKGEY